MKGKRHDRIEARRNIAIVDSGHSWAITPLVRELIDQGYNVHLFVQNKKIMTTRLFPKLKGHIQIPENINNRLIATILSLFNKFKISHLICLDEDIKCKLVHHRPSFRDVRFANPEIDNYLIAGRKATSIKLAEKLGIPVPGSFDYDHIEDIDHDYSSQPLVIKGNGGVSSQHVRYAFDEHQLRDYYDEITELEKELPHADHKPIVQEYVGGPTYLTQTISQHGELKASTSHKKIREWPLSGGYTTRAVTIDEPILADYASRMLKALNWHGEAGFEWKYSKVKDDYYFIEMNPRFEGSLGIAIKAGVNFPRMLIKIMDEEEITEHSSCTKGLHYRWFFQMDFKNFLCRPVGLGRFLWECFDPRVHGEFTPIELFKNPSLFKNPILDLKHFLKNKEAMQKLNKFTVYS